MSTPAPLTVLIGALGGEGGGVLAGWLTHAAEICGFPVQRTSIPGVAQRTGATTYYVEIVPQVRAQTDPGEFALALSPVPGQIDLFVASELLEAGRAISNGLVDPQRTTVLASAGRVFTVVEKSAMGDGRYRSADLERALTVFAKRVVTFDMEATARASGAALSAVMLGAIGASGVLPFPRSVLEEAILQSGKGVEASLRGFAAGFDASGKSSVATPEAPAKSASSGVGERFGEPVRTLVERGYARQLDYQNRKYAERYLDRVADIHVAEEKHGDARAFPATAAVARFLALWMSYEDVIRVADLKSRPERLRRIRGEVGAEPEQPVRVIEYLKPGVEEWCALLPSAAARRLRRWAERRGLRMNVGLHVRTTSIHGFVMLRLLAALRWWRPRSSRFAEEQDLIERWLDEVRKALEHDADLALEIALCGRLIKGYGDTHARGRASFKGILDTLAQPLSGEDIDRAAVVREAREAALADPEGGRLEQSLNAHGFEYVRPAPTPVPIAWHKSARSAASQR